MNYKKNLLTITALSAAHLSNADTSPNETLVQKDPLTYQQWHLQNTGQTSFSLSSGLPGQDLNLDFADRMGIKGRGITVSIIDTGVEISHPDLAANVVSGSQNLLDGSDTPTDRHGHGTAVAGLIAAVEDNGIGGRGVAPYANIIGFNYLDKHSDQSQAKWNLSHGLNDDIGSLDRFTDPRVFNQSYGYTLPVPENGNTDNTLQFNSEEEIMRDITLDSHWGRGAIYVKSAGNSFQYYSYIAGNGERYYVCPNENQEFRYNLGLPFHNANLALSNTSFWNLVVSAFNAEGKLASYSSVGANVFLTAPAGEFGKAHPAMVTTDLTGCNKGSNRKGDHINTLHGSSDLDPNCDYRGTMNGTSSAAPNTAGAIATVMSANPALSSRTIRDILASTARKIDPDHAGIMLDFESATGEQVSYNAIPAWQTNAAGYSFHNFYGFGAVDIDNAVYKALFTSHSLPELKITEWQMQQANVAIPDASIDGAESTLSIDNQLTIESVQLKVNIDHQRLRDIAIELTSPSGTRSVVLNARTGFLNLPGSDTNFTDTIMLSHHFYGEQSQGDWTIKVLDTDKGTSETLVYNDHTHWVRYNSNNNTVDGLLKNWSLRIYGH